MLFDVSAMLRCGDEGCEFPHIDVRLHGRICPRGGKAAKAADHREESLSVSRRRPSLSESERHMKCPYTGRSTNRACRFCGN